MRLGFVSAILPDATLDEVLGTASELGYDCVELMCWPRGRAERRYAGVTHIDAAALTPARADDIRAKTADHGVTISGLGYYPNALSPDPSEAQQAVDQIRHVIAACQTLGLSQFNTFIGRDPAKSVDDNWPRMLEVWRPLVKCAEDHAVRIGIENCPMSFTRDEWPGGKNLAVSPAIWRRLFADLNSDHIGLNYDPSHMIWQHMDPVAPLREFRDRLFHVHAKDVRLDRHKLNDVGILATPLEYHSPKLPGLGDVDWGAFFSTLTDTGYDGAVCVEVEDRAYERDADARRAALRQSCTYLRQFIPRR